MSKESRRDFLKKAGKTIVTGAGWTAVSVLGIGAAGCSENLWCDYCKDCTYYCKSCTNCTSGTGDETVTTGVRLVLSGWGFSSTAIYKINAATAISQVSQATNQFGTWNGATFSGNFTIQHKIYDDVRVEVSRDLFTNPAYSEMVFNSFNTSESSVDMVFNSFPAGVYFSIKSNQPPQSSIGTVNVVIRDQSGNNITSGITDANGIIKFDLQQSGSSINLNVPYTAHFSKTGFADTQSAFTVTPDASGAVSGYVEVIYMATA